MFLKINKTYKILIFIQIISCILHNLLFIVENVTNTQPEEATETDNP